MLAESCDANTQAKGMAYLNLGWGLGNICGESADLHMFVRAKSNAKMDGRVNVPLLLPQGP